MEKQTNVQGEATQKNNLERTITRVPITKSSSCKCQLNTRPTYNYRFSTLSSFATLSHTLFSVA